MCFRLPRQKICRYGVTSQFDYHSKKRLNTTYTFPCRIRSEWQPEFLTRRTTATVQATVPPEILLERAQNASQMLPKGSPDVLRNDILGALGPTLGPEPLRNGEFPPTAPLGILFVPSQESPLDTTRKNKIPPEIQKFSNPLQGDFEEKLSLGGSGLSIFVGKPREFTFLRCVQRGPKIFVSSSVCCLPEL